MCLFPVAVTASLLFALFLLISVFLYKKQIYFKKNRIPHLKPHILWGNMKGVGKEYLFMDPINNVYTNFRNSSILAGISFFLNNTYVALNLEFIKTIMIKDFSYFSDRSSYVNEKDDPLTANMLNLTGKQWKDIRGKLTPTFSSGKMKFMYPTIQKTADEMTDVIKEIIIKDPVINVRDIMSRFTVDVIGSCAFGIECNSLKDPESEFLKKGRLSITKPRHGAMLMSFIRSFPELASKLRFKVIRDDVSKFFLNMVKETVNFREENNVMRNDFMNLLINLRTDPETHLTLNEISAQAFLFFLAGFETSSTTLGFMIYELALNYDIQSKVRTEIQSVIGNNNNIQYEQIFKLTYLDMVFQETLRKYPPAPIVLRKANQTYQVPGEKFVIKKGERIIIPIYAIHHDEQYYKDPEIFDPNRFLPENIATRPSNAWLAFGDGPR